ncbi:MAG: hypothetical protein ACRDGA_12065, partial [Bacteroidota bacterium]
VKERDETDREKEFSLGIEKTTRGGVMRTVLVIGLLLLTSLPVYSQTRFGLGIVVGVPSGVSGTVVTSTTTAVDFQLAWNLNNSFFAQGHYDLILVDLTENRTERVDLYGGPGAFVRLSSGKGDQFGFSGNFGIRWLLHKHIELFGELAPKVGLISETEIDLTGGMGFRYVF